MKYIFALPAIVGLVIAYSNVASTNLADGRIGDPTKCGEEGSETKKNKKDKKNLADTSGNGAAGYGTRTLAGRIGQDSVKTVTGKI